MVEIQCIVSGVVQNVAYRVYAQDAATELSISGWVRNVPDGTVEVCAQGMPDVLKEFIEYLHEGSLRAEVAAVAVEWRDVSTPLEDFSIKYD